MANSEFKLPQSSFSELTKLIIAFSKSKSASSLADLNKLTGIHPTLISSNNGFLDSIDAIQGGNSKEATEIGKRLGLAISNNMEDEIAKNLELLLAKNEFIESMLTALEIKPRSTEDFQSHIAYSLGKELKSRNKTGTGALIEMLISANLIEEKEGLLYLKKKTAEKSVKKKESPASTHTEETADTSENLTSIATKKIVNGLGNNNVTLNINIQLTIPETENEKVYENFFKAMKKHLLS
jgi:hypothetical protein